MNVTPLAKIMAKRMYAQKIATSSGKSKEFYAKIVASLLNDEPFEPVFEVDDRKVRIEKIAVQQEKITAHMVPAS